jgi:aspartate racemase
MINSIIFEELSVGIIKPGSRERLLEVIGRYPADGVILGCTELPLILSQKDCSVPLLDTIDIHTSAILNEAVSGR